MNQLKIRELDELLSFVRRLWLLSVSDEEAQCYLDSINRILDYRIVLMKRRDERFPWNDSYIPR